MSLIVLKLKRYVKKLNICLFMLNYVPDYCKTQEICEKAVSKESFMLKYCLDKCKSQKCV